jgi:transcriptional regulator with XRE-family HTH domain
MERDRNCGIDRMVGGEIKHRRALLGMTQQRLAEQLGISAHQLAKYEQGLARPSPRRLLAIARALNASADVFSARYETGQTALLH